MDDNALLGIMAAVIILFSFSFTCRLLTARCAVIMVIILCALVELIFSIVNQFIGKKKVYTINLAIAVVVFSATAFLLWFRTAKQHKRLRTEHFIRMLAAIIHLIMRVIEYYLRKTCTQCHGYLERINFSAVSAVLILAAAAEKLITFRDETAAKKAFTIVTFGDDKKMYDSITHGWSQHGSEEISLRRLRINGVLITLMELQDVDTLLTIGVKAANVLLIHKEAGRRLNMTEARMKELKGIDKPKIIVHMGPLPSSTNALQRLIGVIDAWHCISVDLQDEESKQNVFDLALSYQD